MQSQPNEMTGAEAEEDATRTVKDTKKMGRETMEDVSQDAEERTGAQRGSPWSICWCGNNYVPSRSSEGECGDICRHVRLQREDHEQTSAPRCSFCSLALPQGSRKSRIFCDANCRNKYAYHVNKDRGSEEATTKDTGFYDNSREGVRVVS